MRSLALALALLVTSPAFAEPGKVLDTREFGQWGGLTFTDENDNLACTLAARWDDGSFMFIKKFTGQAVYAEITAPYWRFTTERDVTVRVVFDGRAFAMAGRTTHTVDTNTSGIVLDIPNNAWLEAFRTAREMRLEFPNSTERPWGSAMRGSAKAMDYLSACADVQAETQPSAPQSADPFAKPAPGSDPAPSADPFRAL